MAIEIILNGQSRVIEERSNGATILDLIQSLGLKADRVAVEHNGEISPRRTWETPNLASGDRLELVHFVGGGSER